MITPASRLAFWRLALGITFPLAVVSLGEVYSLAEKLGVAPFSSKTWLALLIALVLTSGASLFFLVLSFTSQRERLLVVLDGIEKASGKLRWAGFPLFLASLAAYPLTMFQPYYGGLLARQGGLQLFLAWLIVLAGTKALKLARPQMDWTLSFISTLLLQAVIYRMLLYLPDITAYPFATGWSETSRFYYPALFISRNIFGRPFAWPILHPSLHLLLVPPYLLDAPLWFHRFWQVALRFLLVGLIAPALLYRLKIESRPLRWFAGLLIFLYLFTLPLYLHLAVPIFIILWGFSARDEYRTWTALAAASIWVGLSRLNWYLMPGILAAVLYFLEVPTEKQGWRYLLKPALWCVISLSIASLSIRLYIAFSGILYPGNFFTSLSSPLLWARLLPNETYSLGVLPGIVLLSLPLWAIVAKNLRGLEMGWQRTGLLLAALLALFYGGLVVSMKIGGGADIHNMDAYAVLLLVICAYLFFARNTPENGQPVPVGRPLTYHWSVLVLLVLIPAWFALRSAASIWQYDPALSRATLTALQQRVDEVNTKGGEVLFITQRHLITMHMLKNVTLVPEYEREELMEMAMARDDAYLQDFRTDMEKHRFAAIIVDPLRFNLVGEEDAMGAENNAWVRYVAKRILCNYTQDAIFPADRIAIYVPQTEGQKCP